MAAYLAMRLEAGKIDYVRTFSIDIYKPFKADVDAILVADGRQDLIKTI